VANVKRESAIGGATVRTAPTAAATVTVTTVTEIESVPIQLFRGLIARLEITRAAIGDTPTLDLYLQRAIRPSPDPTDDNDWEDFYAFPQHTTALQDLVVTLPLPAAQDVDGSLGSMSRTQAVETLAADTLLSGHWGDQIRIREKITTGGTISTAAQYHLHLTGF